MPADCPVTVLVPGATVAIEDRPLVHVPPGVMSLNEIVAPTHTSPGLGIVIPAGVALTVTFWMA